MIRLTTRQREVVKRVASGLTIKQVALELNIAHQTVEYHWTRARNKIGFRDVARVTQWALKHHLIDFCVK